MKVAKRKKKQMIPQRKQSQLWCIGSSIASALSHPKVYGKPIKPLAGVKADLKTMHRWAIKNKVVYRGSLQLGSELLNGNNKDDVNGLIMRLFQDSKIYKKTYLYYTGHGDEQGNWLLESTLGIQLISPKEILELWRSCSEEKSQLQIILDQCHAGKWFEVDIKQIYTIKGIYQPCLSPTSIVIHASCRADQTSGDWGLEKGGAFTCTRYGEVKMDLDADQHPQKRAIVKIGSKIRAQEKPLPSSRYEQLENYFANVCFSPDPTKPSSILEIQRRLLHIRYSGE